ncbi:MAG: nucleotide exchange factor GrpE [Bacteroidales bacterium]|nr:nucleotide exchange factor GrpE [Bacteroidales bacterium]
MEQNENKKEQEEVLNNEQTSAETDKSVEQEENQAEAQADAENAAGKTPEERIAELEEQLKVQKDQYLRMLADFDNYRKNQLRKTNDLLKYGGESAFSKLLPIIDDFERAIEHNEKADDVNAVKEGFNLIYSKFKTYLEQNEVTVIPANQGDGFDENLHEAITMFPAPAPELKGKIVDCATKGYKYKDKVIRIAKVVVGE